MLSARIKIKKPWFLYEQNMIAPVTEAWIEIRSALFLHYPTKSHLSEGARIEIKKKLLKRLWLRSHVYERARIEMHTCATTLNTPLRRCVDWNQLVFAITFTCFFAPIQRCADRNCNLKTWVGCYIYRTSPNVRGLKWDRWNPKNN